MLEIPMLRKSRKFVSRFSCGSIISGASPIHNTSTGADNRHENAGTQEEQLERLSPYMRQEHIRKSDKRRGHYFAVDKGEDVVMETPNSFLRFMRMIVTANQWIPITAAQVDIADALSTSQRRNSTDRREE